MMQFYIVIMVEVYLKKIKYFLSLDNEFCFEFLPIVERERERERESLLLVYLFNLIYIAIKFFNVWANSVSPFYIVNNKPVCRVV